VDLIRFLLTGVKAIPIYTSVIVVIGIMIIIVFIGSYLFSKM